MYLISAYSHNAAQLTSERKKQIRRNEQISQEQYLPPAIFRMIKVGKPRVLKQGDVVLGKVKVVTTTKIACQLIYVEFKGLAKVEFNVPSTTMIDEIQNFKKEWEFFCHKIPVFMHEQRGYNFLEPGVYEFYFKARVPINGPSTFLTDIASVTYRFSGVFVRNDVTQDLFSENHLTYHVRGCKDINQYQGARIGHWLEKKSKVGGICGLFSGHVLCKVKTDKRAYIPGEDILIIGQVKNSTWRKIKVHYELIQRVKMFGEHYFWRSNNVGQRFLKDSLVMETGKDMLIFPGDDITLEETLRIPVAIEPSYLGMTARDFINDIINLEYKLQVEIDIPYSTTLRLSVPIIIGTEPFIYLPDPPEEDLLVSPKETAKSLPQEELSQVGENGLDETEVAIKLDIMEFGNTDPFKVPRFHPLNRRFQKRFPETFGRRREDGHGVLRMAAMDHHCKCDCDCHKGNHKKRHRSTCKKMVSAGLRRKGVSAERSHVQRVKTDFGQGIPLEECTFSNWLAASIDDYLDDEGKQTNMLLNVMREYGLVS